MSNALNMVNLYRKYSVQDNILPSDQESANENLPSIAEIEKPNLTKKKRGQKSPSKSPMKIFRTRARDSAKMEKPIDDTLENQNTGRRLSRRLSLPPSAVPESDSGLGDSESGSAISPRQLRRKSQDIPQHDAVTPKKRKTAVNTIEKVLIFFQLKVYLKPDKKKAQGVICFGSCGLMSCNH